MMIYKKTIGRSAKTIGVIVVSLLLVLSLMTGCQPKKEAKVEEPDDKTSAVTLSVPSYYFGEKHHGDFVATLDERLTDKQDKVSEKVGVAFVDANKITEIPDSEIDQLKGLYDNGSTIVIMEPPGNPDSFDNLLSKIEHRSVLVEEAHTQTVEIYGFNNKDDHYILGDLSNHDPEAYDSLLEPLFTWVKDHSLKDTRAEKTNAMAGAIAEKLNTSPTDVANTFNYQTITNTFSVTVEGQLRKVALSKADTLSTHSSITVTTHIYPLYSFNDQASPGDYYIVSQQVSTPNQNWYNGRWTNKHGGVHVRLCAWYMKYLRAKNTLGVSSVSLVSQKPDTTIGSTTYNSGITWSLGGSVTGNSSGTISATVNGGVQVSKSESRNISDVNIRNLSSGAEAAWGIDFNNLTSYNSNISINEPATPSRSNQILYSNWVWRVTGIGDNDNSRQFPMTINLGSTEWEGSSFISSGADFKRVSIVPNISTQTFTVAKPNRTPTGSLVLENNTSSNLTNVKVWKGSSKSGNAFYSYPDTVAPSKIARMWLPAGDYYVEMTRNGQTVSMLKSISRAIDSNIYPSDFSS